MTFAGLEQTQELQDWLDKAVRPWVGPGFPEGLQEQRGCWTTSRAVELRHGVNCHNALCRPRSRLERVGVSSAHGILSAGQLPECPVAPKSIPQFRRTSQTALCLLYSGL